MKTPEDSLEQHIPLWADGEGPVDDGFRPWMDFYPLDRVRSSGAVLVFPGGGYHGRAAHEGRTVAVRLNAAGFPAFVVHYSVAPRRHPLPARDAARAMLAVRRRAGEWGVKPNRVAVLGFSAGAHLAGTLGVHFDKAFLDGGGAADPKAYRPDAVVLCYPVVSSGPHGHDGSFANLLGPDAPPDARALLSLESQVTGQTPPTFLWHTVQDGAVPVENSLLFAQALRRHGVPFELHVYPRGGHGLGLAPDDPHVATWFELACQWLRSMGW